jgi:hypothetical protein
MAEGLRAEVHLHCCHSVSKRHSDVTGDYRPILPLLRDARVNHVNLEFAYPGTCEVGDLKLLPDHRGLGMGVVDVRRESVPSVGEIEALGAAGAAIVAPEGMALNPDCGFAPDAGEPTTIDEAYEKLSRLVAAGCGSDAPRTARPETNRHDPGGSSLSRTFWMGEFLVNSFLMFFSLSHDRSLPARRPVTQALKGNSPWNGP